MSYQVDLVCLCPRVAREVKPMKLIIRLHWLLPSVTISLMSNMHVPARFYD